MKFAALTLALLMVSAVGLVAQAAAMTPLDDDQMEQVSAGFTLVPNCTDACLKLGMTSRVNQVNVCTYPCTNVANGNIIAPPKPALGGNITGGMKTTFSGTITLGFH